MDITTNTQSFNSKLIYGATGTGKTLEIGPIALWVYLRTGKKTRLICTDGGGWGPVQTYVEAGLIDPLNLSSEPDALLRLWQASEGRWPRPGSPGVWDRIADQPDWEDIGMIAIEGLSSMADMLMGDLIGDGRKISQDVVGGFEIKDPLTGEKFRFGQPSQSHYAQVHRQLLDMMRNFGGLMSKGVNEILYTALEARGQDVMSQQAVLGPMTVGQKLTGVLPHRVGDCIHLDIVRVEEKNKPARDEHRAYFTNHVDPELGRAWPAKLRLGPDEAREIKEHPEFGRGYMVLTIDEGIDREGVTRLFKWREQRKSNAVERLRSIMRVPVVELVELLDIERERKLGPNADVPMGADVPIGLELGPTQVIEMRKLKRPPESQ